MLTRKRRSIAVIGSGMAGATRAHALVRDGHAVHVFDKARGPGGRLATRRAEWVDRQRNTATTRLDHGALGFMASRPAFQAFAGCVLPAVRRQAGGGRGLVKRLGEEGVNAGVGRED